MAGPRFRLGEELTPLEPEHATVLRIRAAITAGGLFIAVMIAEAMNPLPWLPTGVLLAVWLLYAVIAIVVLPSRRWGRKGYRMSADRLRVVKGYLWQRDSVVPFGRVQHIDLHQSPLERMFSLATLVIHTAGTHNASVPLEGLARENAEHMRDTIRAHIKRETM